MNTIFRFSLITSIMFSFSSYSQLVVNNGFTAQQLGNNLAGSNVNVVNATITGDPEQYGTFQYTGTDLGLNSGVILSSGSIFGAVGPNDSDGESTGYGGPGDADLSALAGFNTQDAVVFEFDFEVQGDEIEFNFVFMSEEYNEFVNTGFNDVFAFYISGPGIVGQQNIAVVPGTTTPVTINSINNGSFWQFFNDNTSGATNIEFDGFTTLMTAFKDGLTPCTTYTLSLRIADGSDDILDSGVLLQENSLVQSNISASSSTFSANNTALEGCIEASFTFELDSALTEDLIIPIGIGGTATNGIDYTEIDSLITIPAGQTSATIIIDAIAEGITEGQEVVELYYTPESCEPQDTIFLYIDDYNPLEYNISPSDVTCFGASDGLVDLDVTGGIAPYTITLTDSVTGDQNSYTTFPVTGLDIGTYYVEVIDGYGCTAEDIVAGNLFDAGQTFIPDGAGGSYQSSINLSGFGAAQTVATPDQIQSVCATLEHSRIGELLITLTSPDGTQVILKEQPGGATCNLGEPCAIGPTDGGTGNTNTDPGIGYTYCWQNIATYGTMVSESNNFTYTYTNPCDGSSQSDKYLPAGSYQPYENYSNFVGATLNGDWTIEVTDEIPNNNGYIFDWSISLQADLPDSIFTLIQPDAPTISSTVISPDCGGSNGSIDLTVTDGAPPFTYLWSNGEVTEDISGITSGTYTVDVTDDSLCVHTYQVDVSSNGSLILTGIETHEVCAGQNNGEIDLSISGTPPFNILWSNGSTDEDISNLAPGNYTVEVNDGSGCDGIATFTIDPAQNININAAITNENCGDGEGIINLTVVGAIDPVSYTWNNGDVTEDIVELSQGQYIVELTDFNGCYATDTFDITNLVGNCVPDCDLEITSQTVLDETCGNGNGSINLTLFSTNGPIGISWDNGETTEDLSSLSAGSYEITLTDNEGCEVIESFDILNQTGTLAIQSINATNENCGNGQGGANATISGGSQPYTYNWSNGATTEDLTNVVAGTYTLTVTDDNGCSVNQTVTIENIAGTLTQTYGNAVDEICGNGAGSIDIQIAGGQAPYSYSWSNGANSQDLTNLSAGSYTCTITDNNQCSITTETYIVENQAGTLNLDDIDIDNEVCSNGLGDIELFISGGENPISVLWNTGASGNQLSNLSAGTYSATITDNSGCSLETGDLIVLNESGTLQLTTVSSFDELCGNATGSINITTTGGAAPLTYDWSNGSTSQDLSNLSAGDYSCIISDVNGCEVFASATINNNPGIINIDNIILTNEDCGQGNGSLDIIVSGAASPVNYSWSNGETTEDISGLNAGSYTIEIIDNNGCTASETATIENNSGDLALTNTIIVNEICGNGTGSIDITVLGSATPISFLWSNGANTEDISGLSEGSYTCVVTDNTGCSINIGPIEINNSAGGLSAEIISTTNETCSNGSGEIDANTTGGTMPYTFSWNSGQTSEDITGLSAGTYILTVIDDNGCQTNVSTEILNSSGTLSIDNIIVNDENCSGIDGSIDITVSGGSPIYDYTWSNAAITEDINSLVAGTYNVSISDQNGCTINSGDIIVNNNSGQFSVDGINIVNESCGDGMGNVDLIVSGASGSVSYTWSNGATSQDLNNVSAGSYSGTAVDANGCTISFSAVVGNDPGLLTVDEIITDVTCGGTNGAIDITVNNASTPNQYVWSNGEITEDISGLTAGTYTCNITDNAGCSITYEGIVSDIEGPSITSVSASDETCGNADGSIQLNINGGAEPLTYSWTGQAPNPCCTYTLDMQDQGNSWNGASIDVYINGILEGNYTVPGGGANIETFDVCDGDDISLDWNQGGFDNEVSFDMLDGSGAIVFSQGGNPTVGTIFTGTASCGGGTLDGDFVSNLSAGTYSVIVTDNNGCQDSTTVILQNTSGSLQITSSFVTNESCSDENGSIDIEATGNGIINYSWSSGETSQDLIDITGGTYIVDLIDQDGCELSETFDLTNFTNGLELDSYSLTEENCGDGTGAINITMTGGAGPLSYSWSNGYTAQNISSLNGGSYSLTVSDGSICTFDTTFVVNNNSGSLLASSSIIDASCGLSNGSIDLSINGGTPPYITIWNNGELTEDLSGLSSGTYSCNIIDDNGCSITISATVVDNGSPIVITGSSNPEDCGDNDGDINIIASGGSGVYTYDWSNGETTEDISNLSQGTYTVIVSDDAGCSSTESFNVESDGNFNYDVSILNEDCSTSNGSISVNFLGFPNPNDILWSTGETTETISNLTSGWYVLEMSSTFGPGGQCEMIDSFFVDVNQSDLFIDSINITHETCSFNDGALDAFVSGGIAPLTYSWSTGEITEDLTGLEGGTYILTVTDNIGCSVSTTAIVDSYTFGFGVTAAIIDDELCSDGTGAIDITLSGGLGPFIIDWDNDGLGDLDDFEDLSSLSAGTYTVYVTDVSGCEISNTFEVENYTGNFTANSVVNDETCGDLNGAIDITVNGGIEPIDYSWLSGETTEDLSGLTGGTFSCTITDDTGCSIEITETVASFSPNFEIGSPILVDENCGDGTGSIVLNPTGGTEPLIYSWDIPNLCCSYTLNMFDLNNNGWGGNPVPEVLVYINGSLYGNFTVPNGSLESVSIPVCTGDLLELEYSEGQQNQNNTYELLDSDGNLLFEDGPNPFNGMAYSTTVTCPQPSSNSATDLNAGDYPIEITDNYGCVIQDTFTINNITGGFEITDVVITDETCESGNGAIDITVSGGSTPYIFNWNNGEATEDLTDLSAGDYDINITDNAGCEINGNYSVINIGSGANMTASAVENSTCLTCTEGSIDLTMDPSGAPYTFSWDNGESSEDISGLTPGIYEVTITNADGCEFIYSFEVLNTASIDEIDAMSIHIFPNPSNGLFEFTYENNNSDEVEFTIYDEAGRIVANWTETSIGNNGSLSIDLSQLTTGTYFMEIQVESGIAQERIIIH